MKMASSMPAMAMRQVGHHVGGAHESVLVMTYNVLAQTYVKSSFFPYCDPLALRWKNRSKKLVPSACNIYIFYERDNLMSPCMRACTGGSVPVAAGEATRDLSPGAHSCRVAPHVSILTVHDLGWLLQEVDNFYEFWAKIMKKQGYEGMYVQKQGRKKEGVAIFWDDSKLNLEMHETIGLDIPIGDESDCNKDLLGRTQRGSVGLITEFSVRNANAETKKASFIVATTHLFWDPLQEDVKLLQTRRMLRNLTEYNEERKMPLIFSGDFNSLPDSEVYRFITDQHSFQSAYAEYDQSTSPSREPEFTNVNGLRNDERNEEIPGFIGTLDYIFYQSPRLRPVALLEIMSRKEATKERSLPSTFSPSDHLPMICEFLLAEE